MRALLGPFVLAALLPATAAGQPVPDAPLDALVASPFMTFILVELSVFPIIAGMATGPGGCTDEGIIEAIEDRVRMVLPEASRDVGALLSGTFEPHEIEYLSAFASRPDVVAAFSESQNWTPFSCGATEPPRYSDPSFGLTPSQFQAQQSLLGTRAGADAFTKLQSLGFELATPVVCRAFPSRCEETP